MIIKNSKSISKNNLLLFFSALLIFVLNRQVPFDNLSYLMNISLAIIFILNYDKIIKKLIVKKDLLFVYGFILSYLVIGLIYSFILLNNFSNAFRFFLILFFLSTSYLFTLPHKIISIFINIYLLHAILIIVFSFYLFLFFSEESYLPIRFFIQEKGWGDIYTYNNIFYRVQIKGNALLPFAYFLTFFHESKYNKIKRSILLIGTVVAGNFAFLLAILFFRLFIFFRTVKKSILIKRLFIMVLILSIIIVPFYNYYVEDIIGKKNESSLPTRVDQIDVLIDDVAENNFTLFFGKGLGNTVEKVTSYRDYRGNTYFELQTVYLFNQIGIVGLIFLLIYNIYITYRTLSGWFIFTYCCYVFYALTNPYIFDTNHIVVILILNTLQSHEV